MGNFQLSIGCEELYVQGSAKQLFPGSVELHILRLPTQSYTGSGMQPGMSDGLASLEIGEALGDTLLFMEI